ncbi:MAG: RnfABCDGE type electron transport complex subunit D [bacterium]|nr:RnfABCDGE type electron transport complex subunit D [bacterium]
MQKKLVVASSPLIRDTSVSTRRLMGDVVIAMLPTALAAVWFFGAPALGLILVAVVSAVLSEAVYQRLTHQKVTIGDLSAVVTGMLLAFNIPANAPWWMAAIGSAIAIILVKQMFGGLGQNFMNPALAARTILMLSWTALMAATAVPAGGQLFGLAKVEADAIASATPLANGSYTLWQLFIGDVPGMLGETCKLTLILGGIYLIVRRVIDWRVPAFFIGTAFVLFLISTGSAETALFHILSGGLMLGAFFMATDYVTCPYTKTGRAIMGIGCAVLLFVIRTYGSYPEGCSFAILFMNVLTPFIDKWTMPKSFGTEKIKGGAKA